MRICVVGGKLQGIEAVYLAKKSRCETTLIDKNPKAPAAWLADEVFILDITKDLDEAKRIFRRMDAVLPATENRRTLTRLESLCREEGIPYMQDNSAFWITSDKLRSQEFFEDNDIPRPEPWPKSGFPVIVKPARRSGSEEVCRANDVNQLEKAIERILEIDGKYVVQEFVDGLSLSLEVVAKGGNPYPLQIIQLEFDDTYSCKRVFAPDMASDVVRARFIDAGKKVARGLNLTGLTDIQAIVGDGIPKVNEINARLPSQTPTAVYHSSNINMIELLLRTFLEDNLPRVRVTSKNAVIYQHVKIVQDSLMVIGEHAIADAEGLKIERHFFGADEAITNITDDEDTNGCVATLIVKDKTLKSSWQRMNEVTRNIMVEYHLTKFVDQSPKESSFTDGQVNA